MAKRLSVIICISISLVLCASILIRLVFSLAFLEHGVKDSSILNIVYFDALELLNEEDDTEAIGINWAEAYPFMESDVDECSISDTEEKTQSYKNVLEKYTNIIQLIKDKTAEYSTTHLVLHDQEVYLANNWDALIGWEIADVNEYNRVVTLDDGCLATLMDRQDVSSCIEQTIALKSFLDKQGINMLYVQAPVKTCESDVEVYGVTDFANQNADDLLAGLVAADIDYIDLREKLKLTNTPFHDYFYKTDHHWKAETALWAAGEISDYLNSKISGKVKIPEIFSLDLYTSKVYKNRFLGSEGQKITLARCDPEDFLLLYPEFSVHLSFEIPRTHTILDGDFDITYDYTKIDEPDIYKRRCYGAFAHADQALIKYHNYNLEDGMKLLVIGDSYDNAVTPFLSLGVSDLDVLDLRSFTGSLETFISQNDYDYVIVV